MRNFICQILFQNLPIFSWRVKVLLKSINKYCHILLLALAFNINQVMADDTFDWMNTDMGLLGNLFHCKEVPEDLKNFKQFNISLNLAQPNIWQPTRQRVQKDKAIKFDWNTMGAIARSKQYRVLYRVDPRFERAQVFIKQYDYNKEKFVATDFPKFDTTDPSKDYEVLAFNKMQEYVDYFNFDQGRKKIRIERGDVINITISDSGEFFGIETDENLLTGELDKSVLGASMIFTRTDDNRILYSTAERYCEFLDEANRNVYCSGTGVNTKFRRSPDLILVGNSFSLYSLGASSCPDMANTNDNNPLCLYDQGRGMRITVGGKVIKREAESFFRSSILGKNLLYYKADAGGDLDFSTNWQIGQDMFPGLDKPLMKNWVGAFSSFSEFKNYINTRDLSANYLHFGRYILTVEIGQGDKTIGVEEQQAIGVEYIIVADNSTPNNSTAGTQVNQNFTIDADKDGTLWFRVINPNPNVVGNIRVNYASYTGSTWFSDLVYNKVILPITSEFHKFTMNLYTKLAKNASLQRIANIAMVMYVSIYALMFLAGATQITAKDLITRLIKISLIIILIGDNSWEFFNEYLFDAFIRGTDYLMTNIVGLTGSKSNIFGFVDPIFDKYTDSDVWGLLFIQLLQLHNGLTFVAIVSIYSLILYFRAVLEVIISYVMAYIGLSVMISLAPFFIILMLFEQTKSIFDNWLSTLFSYMIQPTILLIFFLLIDQIMAEQLLKVVVRACWGTLIPIEVGLDLTHMDIPVNFSFPIPFLPGIPFFVPSPTPATDLDVLMHSTGTFLTMFSSSLILYCYALMAYGLVDYISIVVAQLTNVTPARQEGDFQAPTNPTASIFEDIKSVTWEPASHAISSAGRLIKDKTIDQNYRATTREPSKEKKEGYTGKIFASRNDGDSRDD